MDAGRDAWIARSAAAMCAASRWLFAASLALSIVGFACGARGGWAAVSALGVVQIYLAARIEFDRVIFDALAARPEEAARFDEALAATGRMPPQKAGRPMEQRAAGAWRLVIAGGVVFMAQIGLAGAIAWAR